MNENKLSFDDGQPPLWLQVARNKAGVPVETRMAPLRSNLYQTVEDYAEFCAHSGGDRHTSVLSALKEIRNQSRELVEKVYQAPVEHEVEIYGAKLARVIELHKALEAYYVDNFFPLRTGTSGDD